ncbi:MAG: hypothetical protein ACE5GE_15390, partial [Phycisphaerae bacterium]
MASWVGFSVSLAAALHVAGLADQADSPLNGGDHSGHGSQNCSTCFQIAQSSSVTPAGMSDPLLGPAVTRTTPWRRVSPPDVRRQ